MVTDTLCDIPCKLVHVPSGAQLEQHVKLFQKHFVETGCPVMMGGDRDNSSKGIFGICSSGDANEHYLLVVDPHYVATTHDVTPQLLVDQGWVKWVKLSHFEADSFYNICLPQVKNMTVKM